MEARKLQCAKSLQRMSLLKQKLVQKQVKLWYEQKLLKLIHFHVITY